jgi:uncharacterized protein (TIGR00290 family)
MLDETGERSRSHGLPLAVLKDQADALGLRLVVRSTNWFAYTDAFTDALQELRASGHSECVFGDIDITAHRDWCTHVCHRAGLAARHPLWQQDRRRLVEELIDRGFDATIVVIRPELLDRSFLGRRLDREIIDNLEAIGVDACGENGEFHTVITDGPPFARAVSVSLAGIYAVADCLALQARLGTRILATSTE